ncbi:hypothetical protein L1987_50676 [Smallanthus sonchifolius]|uniref:Uncharacterized protein n=1 Tax=Smallanthus sonchifolius TaxID=185202 RepID=A0ACB9EMJ6_9ASTR|nr:hypothetical protein L1987_50676 [Smallanthus sonchifolius]
MDPQPTFPSHGYPCVCFSPSLSYPSLISASNLRTSPLSSSLLSRHPPRHSNPFIGHLERGTVATITVAKFDLQVRCGFWFYTPNPFAVTRQCLILLTKCSLIQQLRKIILCPFCHLNYARQR